MKVVVHIFVCKRVLHPALVIAIEERFVEKEGKGGGGRGGGEDEIF